jgi:hypothetical protein
MYFLLAGEAEEARAICEAALEDIIEDAWNRAQGTNRYLSKPL